MTATVMISKMKKENIIVSACLLGVNCKYNGNNNYCQKVVDLKEKYNLITICPEVDGGLPTPRIPSEIVNDKVINEAGIDVTSEYNLGAKKALDKALENNVKKAILKAKSKDFKLEANKLIEESLKKYEKTDFLLKYKQMFLYRSGIYYKIIIKEIKGDGVTTKLFKENNIEVITEENL